MRSIAAAQVIKCRMTNFDPDGPKLRTERTKKLQLCEVRLVFKQLILFVGLPSLLVTACTSEDADDMDADQANGAFLEELAKATEDSQSVTSGDLTVLLNTFDAQPGEHDLADNLGLTGRTSAFVYRNDKMFIAVLPSDESYYISVSDPEEADELLATIVLDSNTGLLTQISYSGVSDDGSKFTSTDFDVDGQPEVILSGEDGKARIWLVDRWEQVVKQDGRRGVVLNGKWREVRRDHDTMQFELLETPEPRSE